MKVYIFLVSETYIRPSHHHEFLFVHCCLSAAYIHENLQKKWRQNPYKFKASVPWL